MGKAKAFPIVTKRTKGAWHETHYPAHTRPRPSRRLRDRARGGDAGNYAHGGAVPLRLAQSPAPRRGWTSSRAPRPRATPSAARSSASRSRYPTRPRPYIGICRGIPGFVPEDEAYSFYYIYGDEGQYCGFISAIIAAGRRDFFNPGRYYNSDEHSAHYPIAASEEYVYMYQGGIGGYDLPFQKREGQEAAERAVSPVGLFDNLSVDSPSALPEISAETLRGASETIGALGDGILTRGETASLVFEMIDAENKDAPYPLRFTDVDPESEAARAAAYLDSYGMFARYDEDNALIDDGNLFARTSL